MTKKLVLALAFIITSLSACGKTQATDTTKVAETSEVETTEEVTEEATEEVDENEVAPMVINMGTLINEMAEGKPVVTIDGDDGAVCSFDFSVMGTNKVEVTLSEPVEKGYLYVMMAGNVTEHTLLSDGSLFDGIAEIVEGKAEFSITYDDEKKIDFIINVPMS